MPTPDSLSLPSILLLVSAGLNVCLGLAVLRAHRDILARQFFAFMLTAGIYAAGYAWEINAPDMESMKMALRVEYLGAPFATAYWVMLAYGYLWQRRVRRVVHAALLTMPVITLCMVATNDWHHLFYASLEYTRVAGLTIARIGHGFWYGVHFIFVNACFLVGNFFLLRAWRISQPLYRRQAVLMVIGSFVPWAGYIIYLAGWSPYGIDLTPFGLSLTGVAAAMAVWYLGFLNIIPVARDTVLECIRDGVVVLDTRYRVIDFNSNAARFFPELAQGRLGIAAATLFDLAALREAAALNHRQRIERETDGTVAHYELNLRPLVDRHEIALGAVVTVTDVTQEVLIEKHLREQANSDELTGLGNRHYLMEQSVRVVRLAQRHARPLAVMVIDLDFFKQTNDEKGHLAGDEQLRGVADLIRTRLRQTDIVGRFGGDEFVVTLPETPLPAAMQIAEALCQSARENLGVSLSIGVAPLCASCADFQMLLQQADANLYRAKESGRGRVIGKTVAAVDI